LLYLCPFKDSSILKEATVSPSSISPGSLLDSPLASTLTPNTNQSLPTSTNLTAAPALNIKTASALNGNTASTSIDPLTQDLLTLLKDLAFGDIAGAKTALAKYKADVKAQTAAADDRASTKNLASLYRTLTNGNTAETQAVTQSDSLVASISASLNSGSVKGALKDLTGYLVQNGQISGGLINTLG
jgi:hypothetical protein